MDWVRSMAPVRDRARVRVDARVKDTALFGLIQGLRVMARARAWRVLGYGPPRRRRMGVGKMAFPFTP